MPWRRTEPFAAAGEELLEVGAAVVIKERAARVEPGIVAVKLGAEPRVHAGAALVNDVSRLF